MNGSAIGTGVTNTAAMAASSSFSSDGSGTNAGDWFLPSRDELNAMYNYSRFVGLNSATYGFTSTYHWSSSQSTAISAWNQRFNSSGIASPSNKIGSLRVRSIRAFAVTRDCPEFDCV